MAGGVSLTAYVGQLSWPGHETAHSLLWHDVDHLAQHRNHTRHHTRIVSHVILTGCEILCGNRKLLRMVVTGLEVIRGQLVVPCLWLSFGSRVYSLWVLSKYSIKLFGV